MVAVRDGKPVAVVSFGGEIYNFRELRAELAAHGHGFRTDCDTEVLLTAYLEWGADCLSRLNGMFAFAAWDIQREELLLARDQLGVKPLFYYPTEAGIIFGSEPKALLAHPSVKAIVDEDGLRELFGHGRTPGKAVFRNMPEVRPGHAIRISRAGGLREHRYWALAANQHTEDLDSTVTHVRHLLEDVVARQLIADVPTSVLLSGGIDSSTLTALAAATLRRQGTGPVRTYSMSFTGYTENFEPMRLRGTPDPPYVGAVAAHVGTEHNELVLDAVSLADPAVRRATLLCHDLPTHLGDMDSSAYLGLRALRERSTVVTLSGEGADEVFNGYFWAYDPRFTGTDTFPWVAFERGHKEATGGLGLGLLDPGLRKRLDLLGYADDHYRSALAEVPVLDGEPAEQRRAREIQYLTLTRWLPPLLDRMDRLSMAVSVELRVPYCDHRLVQYVFDVPAAMKRTGDQEKSLLRAAVSDLLPPQVVNRPKSAYPVIQDGSYGRLIKDRFVELATDSGAPVLPLLDADATANALADTSTPEGAFAWVERANYELALQLNSWLTEYHISLNV
jgi:asparagine synthase (glutamine-hydrolysing)